MLLKLRIWFWIELIIGCVGSAIFALMLFMTFYMLLPNKGGWGLAATIPFMWLASPSPFFIFAGISGIRKNAWLCAIHRKILPVYYLLLLSIACYGNWLLENSLKAGENNYSIFHLLLAFAGTSLSLWPILFFWGAAILISVAASTHWSLQ